MNNTPRVSIIDLTRKSRNLKVLIKDIKPILSAGSYTLYAIKEKHNVYILAVLGTPEIKTRMKYHRDVLSGLKYSIREAMVYHLDKPLIYVYWDESFYKIKLVDNPFSLKIKLDNLTGIIQYTVNEKMAI